MIMVPDGIKLIKESEGFSARPYLDPLGIPTIGYGTTYYPDGNKVTMKDPAISKELAEAFLKKEVEEKAHVLLMFFEVIDLDLKPNEFSALVSFAYNVGQAPIIEGGRSMNIALKSKDKNKIADAFLLYNKGTKKILGIPKKVVLPGLAIRRQKERELFLKS